MCRIVKSTLHFTMNLRFWTDFSKNNGQVYRCHVNLRRVHPHGKIYTGCTESHCSSNHKETHWKHSRETIKSGSYALLHSLGTSLDCKKGSLIEKNAKEYSI